MCVNDLVPGKRYITTIRDLPRVTYREVKEAFPDGALLVIESCNRLYLIASDQIIKEA